MSESAVTGSLNASGGSVDEIITGAREQIARIAGRRSFGIKHMQLRPLLSANGGEIRIWEADVEFEIFHVDTDGPSA